MSEQRKCPDCGEPMVWGEPGSMMIQQRHRTDSEQCVRNQLAQRLRSIEDDYYRVSAILGPLLRLRDNEGASVTILCPNPDDGMYANEIEVCDEWTGWKPRRFGGDTLAEALEAAEAAKENSDGA